MAKILVMVPAFNEHVKLKNTIDRFLKSSTAQIADYLIVDDCSTDGTTALIKSYEVRGVKTIRHEKRSGVGSGIRSAITYARHKGYEILIVMAGNDKDNPDEIPHVLDPILKDGYDFVQGSRYKGKVGTGGDMPFYRKLATRMHPFLMGLFAGRHLTDSTNGFRAFRLSIFNDSRINIDQDWLNAYELEPYILFKVIRLGYKFTEVFVTKVYPSKKLGYTKMAPVTGWWSILKPVFYLGLGIKK
ncbi:MAG: glycosyltransferase family 2 protein [Candidatus Omnitrophica bacterium]|nr:glycosyltransferase family 2 protein [Candidatus Omnitrophota bacterium]